MTGYGLARKTCEVTVSENLTKLFTTQFSTNLQLKLQQKQSKIRGRVMEGFHVGKQASPVQYYGAVQMKAPAGRFAPLGRQDADFSRRWVLPVDKEAAQLIDSFDELKTIVDPKSQYSDGAAAAVSREWDDRIISAAFATALLGTDSSAFTNETFDTSKYQITIAFGASASVGVTVQKMIEAKRRFRKAHVDLETEPVTWVTNSQGESDLLNQVQVVSTEFNDRPVLHDGKVTRFLGFDIVYSERLSSDGTTRKNIAFAKSGMYLGIWKDTVNRVDIRTDLSGLPYQLYTGMSCGATRLEPGKTLEIDCADTSDAADVTP